MMIEKAKMADAGSMLFETSQPPIRVFEQTLAGLMEVQADYWKMVGTGFQLKCVPHGQMWAQVSL